MANRVTRRFTMDTNNIYNIDAGFIKKTPVLKYIRYVGNPYESLKNSAYNVGWTTGGKSLMFTDEDEILRVDSDRVIEMMCYDSTIANKGEGSDILTLSYDADIFSDYTLGVDRCYKNFDKAGRVVRRRTKAPSKSSREGFTRCVFVSNPVSVYYANDGYIYREHILDYIATHREEWREHLLCSNSNTGYILGVEDVFLRIYNDKIDRLKMAMWEPLIRDKDSKVEVRSSSLYDYVIIEYNSNVFSDNMLLSSVL